MPPEPRLKLPRSVRHPDDAYVRPDGYRDLTMEVHVRRVGGVVTVADRNGDPEIVQVNLSPEGLDFLIDSLPQGDGFTEQLRYAKRLAKDALWQRMGGEA